MQVMVERETRKNRMVLIKYKIKKLQKNKDPKEISLRVGELLKGRG